MRNKSSSQSRSAMLGILQDVIENSFDKQKKRCCFWDAAARPAFSSGETSSTYPQVGGRCFPNNAAAGVKRRQRSHHVKRSSYMQHNRESSSRNSARRREVDADRAVFTNFPLIESATHSAAQVSHCPTSRRTARSTQSASTSSLVPRQLTMEAMRLPEASR